jgi:hypothetical protein
MSYEKIDKMIARLSIGSFDERNTTSLELCLSTFLKSSFDEGKYFLEKVCQQNICIAALCVNRMNKYRKELFFIIIEQLKFIDFDVISQEDLPDLVKLSIILKDDELFIRLSQYLDLTIIEKLLGEYRETSYFYLFYKLLIQYINDTDLLDQIEEHFCSKYMVFDSINSEELHVLVNVLIDYDRIRSISAICQVIGESTLVKICSIDIYEVYRYAIICGITTDYIWYQYIDYLLEDYNTYDELLYEVIGFIELFQEGYDNDLLIYSLFQIALKKGLDHKVLEHVNQYCELEYFSNKTINVFKEIITNNLSRPYELEKFLKTIETCNPYLYSNPRFENEKYRIKRASENFEHYTILQMLFMKKCAPETIVNLFFNSFFVFEMPLQDLFFLAQQYEILPEILSIINKLEFVGIVKKIKKDTLIVAPIEYFSIDYHQIYAEVGGRLEENKEVEYIIKNYIDGVIQVEYKENNLEISKIKDVWANCLSTITNGLQSYAENKSLKKKYLNKVANFSNFNADFFENILDLNELILIFEENINYFPAIVNISENLSWNLLFAKENTVGLSQRYFRIFKKYLIESIAFFSKIKVREDNSTFITFFYLHSIFKVIIPLEVFLNIYKGDELKYIKQSFQKCEIYCRIHQINDTEIKIRAINILCYSSAVILDGVTSELVEKDVVVKTRFKQFDKEKNKINFEFITDSIESEGDFSYIAMNNLLGGIRINNIKSLPDSDSIKDLRAVVYCLEDAVYLRRNNVYEVVELLSLLNNSNPFRDRFFDFRSCYVYLEAVKEEKRFRTKEVFTSIILNANHISDILNIYYNTHIKYIIPIDHLVNELQKRKKDSINNFNNEISKYTFIGYVGMDESCNKYIRNLYAMHKTLYLNNEKITSDIVSYKLKLENNRLYCYDVNDYDLNEEEKIGSFFCDLACLMLGFDADEHSLHRLVEDLKHLGFEKYTVKEIAYQYGIETAIARLYSCIEKIPGYKKYFKREIKRKQINKGNQAKTQEPKDFRSYIYIDKLLEVYQDKEIMDNRISRYTTIAELLSI